MTTPTSIKLAVEKGVKTALVTGRKSCTLCAAAALFAAAAFAQQIVGRGVPFVPTPASVVEEMLELAKAGPGDVIYDSVRATAAS